MNGTPKQRHLIRRKTEVIWKVFFVVIIVLMLLLLFVTRESIRGILSAIYAAFELCGTTGSGLVFGQHSDHLHDHFRIIVVQCSSHEERERAIKSRDDCG